MAVSYTCPNPDCGATLKTSNRVQAGKSVKCPKCNKPFVPETEESPKAGGTFKLADEPEPAKKPTSPTKPGAGKPGAKSEAPKSEAPPAKPKVDDDDDADSVRKGYGVVKESEEEVKELEKNKPKFTEVQDKFKKSARGPAMALLVIPSQLLTAEGLITVVGGLFFFVVGMWPLVFNDAPPGDEETEEAVATMALGIFTFVWGVLICYGASQMHELGSYTWSVVGSVIGILPILVGIFAIIMLMNPKVKAGFEEGEAGPDEEDEDEDKDDADDDDDDDDDDDGEGAEEDEDEKPKRRKVKVSRDDEDD